MGELNSDNRAVLNYLDGKFEDDRGRAEGVQVQVHNPSTTELFRTIAHKVPHPGLRLLTSSSEDLGVGDQPLPQVLAVTVAGQGVL